MHPECAGRALRRLARRLQRRGENFGRVGDHGRQDRGRSLAPMSGGDRADRLRRRRRVEQHAAAAIDLPIDEAGRKNAAAEIVLRAAARALGDGGDPSNRAVLDDERAILAQRDAVEQARAIEDLQPARPAHVSPLSLAGRTPPAKRIAPSAASNDGRRSAACGGASR